MKQFYVVLYDFDKKTSPRIVRTDWIYPPPDAQEFAARRYIYYDTDFNAQPPSTNAFFHSFGKLLLKILLVVYTLEMCFLDIVSYLSACRFSEDNNHNNFIKVNMDNAEKYARNVVKLKFKLKDIRSKQLPTLDFKEESTKNGKNDMLICNGLKNPCRFLNGLKDPYRFLIG
jgi:hypothetical protein